MPTDVQQTYGGRYIGTNIAHGVCQIQKLQLCSSKYRREPNSTSHVSGQCLVGLSTSFVMFLANGVSEKNVRCGKPSVVLVVVCLEWLRDPTLLHIPTYIAIWSYRQ